MVAAIYLIIGKIKVASIVYKLTVGETGIMIVPNLPDC